MPGERLVGILPEASSPAVAFDTRTDEELREAAQSNSDPVERDRAVWELTRRQAGLDVASVLAESDPEESVRRSAAWAVLRMGGQEAVTGLAASDLTVDNDTAWCSMLELEAAEDSTPPDRRPVRWIDRPGFDQTVPLDIAGFARVRMPDGTALEATVSPLWFEKVVGGVTACTLGASFSDTLVIQKRMPGFYPDGRDHVEGYLFKGLSFTEAPDRRRHVYECVQHHRVFRSGKVGDESDGVIDDASVMLMRAAETTLNPNLSAGGGPFVSSVRGSFYGFAYVRPDLVVAEQNLQPGMVQLVSPSDPGSGALANTLLYGQFRGMPRDVDGDGQVEANGIDIFVNPQGDPV